MPDCKPRKSDDNAHSLPLQPVEQGKSWELNAMVVASVLAAGGVLFGVTGCTPRILPGSIVTMGRNYNRQTSEAATEHEDSTTQDAVVSPMEDDDIRELKRISP